VARKTFVEEQFIAFENIQPYNIRELIGEGPNNCKWNVWKQCYRLMFKTLNT
jgi:hypothetical protein